MASGKSFFGFCASLAASRYGVEAYVGKEDHSRGAHHAVPACWRKWPEVGHVDRSYGSDDEEEQYDDLDDHHDEVHLGAFPNPADQQPHDDECDDHRWQIETRHRLTETSISRPAARIQRHSLETR
jgi:hypothetical protein